MMADDGAAWGTECPSVLADQLRESGPEKDPIQMAEALRRKVREIFMGVSEFPEGKEKEFILEQLTYLHVSLVIIENSWKGKFNEAERSST